MKELACQLLGYLKQDLCKLYKEPLFISLLAVTLLIAGLRYLLVALILWAIFIGVWYMIRIYWLKSTNTYQSFSATKKKVAAEATKTVVKKAVAKKKTVKKTAKKK